MRLLCANSTIKNRTDKLVTNWDASVDLLVVSGWFGMLIPTDPFCLPAVDLFISIINLI